MWVNPSKRLVDRALKNWNSLLMRADNTSVVTLLLNPPCSQGGCKLSKTTIVSHNHDLRATERVADPVPSEGIAAEPLVLLEPLVDYPNVCPLTNELPRSPEPVADEPKIKNPLNDILPLLNTKHSSDYGDFRNGRSTSAESAVRCSETDSPASLEENLR